MGQKQAGDNRVDADRLAGAGGAGDQQVGHAGQVGNDGLTLDIFTKRDAQAALHLDKGFALHQFLEADDVGRLVGHFDADVVGARNRRFDAHAGSRQGQGQVVGEPGDLRYFDLDALLLAANLAFDIAGLDQVLGDRWTLVGALKIGRHAKERQRFLDQAPLIANQLVAVADTLPVVEYRRKAAAASIPARCPRCAG